MAGKLWEQRRDKHLKVPSGMSIQVLLIVEIMLALTIISEGVMCIGSNASDRSLGILFATTLLYIGLFHPAYVYYAGKAVNEAKWRGYAIGTIVAISLGSVIALLSAFASNYVLASVGLGIGAAAMLLLCVYHLVTKLGENYALTYNRLLDNGYFDEQERKKKAEEQRKRELIKEKADNLANQTRASGTRVEPVKPGTRITPANPGAGPKPATPPKPTASAEQKPQSGEEKPTGHRLKL